MLSLLSYKLNDITVTITGMKHVSAGGNDISLQIIKTWMSLFENGSISNLLF